MRKKLYTGVNTDPGAEVIYNGELWNIVKTHGDRATIEDEVGTRNMVSLDKLDPGRTRHSNSWNYGSGFNSSFISDGSAQVHAGKFCWVPSRPDFREYSDWEMACVRNIAPDGFHCCVFIDGEYVVCKDIWPIDDELSEMLNSERKYLTFVEACLRGADCTHVVQFDDNDILMLLGITESVAAKLPVVKRGKVVCPVVSENRKTVKNNEDVERNDVDEEFQKLNNIPMGKLVTLPTPPMAIGW